MAKKKLDVVLQGLVTIFGPFGVGKSTLGWLASTDPTKIVYIDGGTSKERDIADSLKMNIVNKPNQKVTAGSYVDLAVMTLNMDDLDTFVVQKELIEGLPDGLSVIVLDDVYFSGAHAYVRKNPKDFKEGGIHGADISMKTAMEWGAARKMLLPNLYTTLRNKATLVLFLNRERPARDENGNLLPGMVESDADKSLHAASMLSIKLTHNTREVSNIPAGLVIKNSRTVIPAERRVEQTFPKRIPACDWDTIQHYTQNPVGNGAENENEVPDETELHSIWGTLSAAQQEQYHMSQQLAIAGVRESMAAAVKEKAAELAIPNKTAAAMAVYSALAGPEYPLLDQDFVEANIE